MNDTDTAPITIRNEIAHIPAWGWDSTQKTIFGYPVQAWTNGWQILETEERELPPNVPGGEPGYMKRSKAIEPAIHLSFANGWTMTIAPDEPRALGRGYYVANKMDMSTIGYPPTDMDESRKSYQYFDTVTPEEARAIIEDVAQRAPWQHSKQ